MGYTYRNKKTKEVINTSNKVTGKNWELVEDADPEMPNGEDFEEDGIEDNPIDEETNQTEVAEEAPVVKPKASRRGKK